MALFCRSRVVDKVLIVFIACTVVIGLYVSQQVVAKEESAAKKEQEQVESLSLLPLSQQGRQTRRRDRRQRGNHHHHDPTAGGGVNDLLRPPQQGPGFADTGGELPSDPNPNYSNPKTWDALDNFACLHQQAQPVYAWQTQAPYAILLGAMKAGTQALMYYLQQHPNVTTSQGETHFFNSPDWFTSTPQGISQVQNQKAYANKMQRVHPDLFVDTTTSATIKTTTIKPNLIAMDSTPYYLLASDRVPHYITCVAPWAKLIAILRNPVERAASHYRYLAQARARNHKPMVSWERWVQHDFQLLQQAGVVVRDDGNATSTTQASFGSSQDDELQAWKRYVRRPNSQHLLGRGLYALQLEQYYAALDRTGRPRSDLHVILSEDLRHHTQRTYDELLRFLNLPPHTLRDVRLQHETTKDVGAPMPDHVRAHLEQFYAPYNQRLFRLLNWNTSGASNTGGGTFWPSTAISTNNNNLKSFA